MTTKNLIRMHAHASHHDFAVSKSTECGCFHCVKTFTPQQITEWIDNGQTAVCPFCGVDSVIPDRRYASAADTSVLQQMHDFWFAEGEGK